MEAPTGHETTPDRLDADAFDVVEVHVSESEFRVYEALGRLLSGAEFWCGSQDTLAAEADYDKRTVRTATRRLEARGLVRMWAEPGRPLSYVLTAAADGRPFVVRRRAGNAKQGRDVVRSASPVGLAQSQIDALLASLAQPAIVESQERIEGRITGADQGGGSGRITGADQGGGSGRITGADQGGGSGRISASVSPAPSMSSSSSSIRPLPPIRPPDPPSPPPGAGPGAEASSSGGGEPLPEGFEPVVAALVAIDVDPEPWLVRELALAPDPSVWQQAIRAAHEHDAETPLYVSRCFATALRKWQRVAQQPAEALEATEPSPQPEAGEGAGVAVTVRPMPNPRPLSLSEVGGVAVEVARGALGRFLRGRRGS